jgi:hypothetical protein
MGRGKSLFQALKESHKESHAVMEALIRLGGVPFDKVTEWVDRVSASCYKYLMSIRDGCAPTFGI